MFVTAWRHLAGLAFIIVASAGTGVAQAQDLHGRKVLFIDSYDESYPWSADITRAIRSVMDEAGVSLRISRMKTKSNSAEEYIITKGVELKVLINSYQPDVVIACDDNAARYVVAPYLRNTATPVVFCGINWDAGKYGFPADNVTGMVEFNPVAEIIAILKAAGGNPERIGVLAPDNETERADIVGAKEMLGVTFRHVRHVQTFAEWKAAYVDLQGKVDMLVVQNNAGIAGWDDAEAARVVNAATTTLTASFNPWMAPYAAVIYAKIGTEQGRWAAQTALRILDGAKPADIPLAHNKENALLINARLHRMSPLKIPPAYFAAAAQVIE
jgi:ABC-type uncharacterized transport system substrate-binding protein